jgi:hypothetical protein
MPARTDPRLADRIDSGGVCRGDHRGLSLRLSNPLVREDPCQRDGDQHRRKKSDQSVSLHAHSPFTSGHPELPQCRVYTLLEGFLTRRLDFT